MGSKFSIRKIIKVIYSDLHHYVLSPNMKQLNRSIHLYPIWERTSLIGLFSCPQVAASHGNPRWGSPPPFNQVWKQTKSLDLMPTRQWTDSKVLTDACLCLRPLCRLRRRLRRLAVAGRDEIYVFGERGSAAGNVRPTSGSHRSADDRHSWTRLADDTCRSHW